MGNIMGGHGFILCIYHDSAQLVSMGMVNKALAASNRLGHRSQLPRTGELLGVGVVVVHPLQTGKYDDDNSANMTKM